MRTARTAVRIACSSGCPVPRSVAIDSAPTSSAARIGCSLRSAGPVPGAGSASVTARSYAHQLRRPEEVSTAGGRARGCHSRTLPVVRSGDTAIAWQEEWMSPDILRVRDSRDVPMGDRELEALRRRGFGVAYRMLGSVTEAEDVAQEALLRLTRHDGPIDEPAAWIMTVVTRLSINVLRSARARRESYVGPWLPEPLLEDPGPSPAARAELADSLSLALLVLLERLNPFERAAYLLHDVFGYGYTEIAGIIERSEVNSRQLVTRARKRIEASRPRFDPDEAAREALLERFLAAAEDGDLKALEELLAQDAVLYADSGGKAMAPPEPLSGAALIARFMALVARVRPS